MTSWDNQFQDLKNQFVARSKERLVAIDTLLTRLQSAPSDVGLLRQIMQHFHWLAGSGGTYGFDDITQWGTYGEELCDYLLKLAGPVSFADQDKLMTALRTVEQLFAAQAPAPSPVNTYPAPEPAPQAKMKGSGELLTSTGTQLLNAIQEPGSGSPVGAAAAGQPLSHYGNMGGALPGSPLVGNSAPATNVGQTSSTDRGYGAAAAPTRNTGQYQTQSAPGDKPGTYAPPGILSPPMTFVGPPPTQENTMSGPLGGPSSGPLGGPSSGPMTAPIQQPHRIPTVEVRKSTRLAHIPTDRKFAIFVDSNVSNLSPIKIALEERGLIVEGFSTAQEVRTLFAERLPDVLIVGAPLIDNNGYELVEYLRGLEMGHKPIVLLLGQQAVFVDKVKAIRAGADAFFEYPAELTDLLDKLNALLDRNKSESYKVLSVEDDPDQANFIKLTLQSAGCTVLHIVDPKQFEENFLEFEPDLVLLDVMLGDMTGFEIAKYIRQNDRFATVPIVFLTTQNKLAQHIRSAMSGGDEHLIKPVAAQLLIATVASRVERARSLKRLIDRDGLTRCLNYGSFMERAQKLATLDGFRSAPAMMMIDVDNMKKINEKLGFAAGDRVISNIANMLLKGFRNTDLIARFGNDQFAIVLEHLNAQQLQSLSSQVLGAISGTPQLVKGRPVSVTCSGGIAVLEQGMTVQEWLASAQDALKKAKEAGGNRAIVKPASRV